MQGKTFNLPGGMLVIAFMASMVLRYDNGTQDGAL